MYFGDKGGVQVEQRKILLGYFGLLGHVPGDLWPWGDRHLSRRIADTKGAGRWVGQSPKLCCVPGRRRKEGRPQAGGRKRGRERGKRRSFTAQSSRASSAAPRSARSPAASWKLTALLSPAKRPLAMGSLVLRSALLLPPVLFLLLLLRVPPSHGFPGRSQRRGFLPSWTLGTPDPPLEPFALDPGRCGGHPLFTRNSSFLASGTGQRGAGLAPGHLEGRAASCIARRGVPSRRPEPELPLRPGFQSSNHTLDLTGFKEKVWLQACCFLITRHFAPHTVAHG